ncbi:hypothetical protein JCM8208_005293 [Rhodotorula glutinis]
MSDSSDADLSDSSPPTSPLSAQTKAYMDDPSNWEVAVEREGGLMSLVQPILDMPRDQDALDEVLAALASPIGTERRDVLPTSIEHGRNYSALPAADATFTLFDLSVPAELPVAERYILGLFELWYWKARKGRVAFDVPALHEPFACVEKESSSEDMDELTRAPRPSRSPRSPVLPPSASFAERSSVPLRSSSATSRQ